MFAKTIKTIEELLNLINEFLAVVNKGTKAVEEVIDDIFKAIKEWLQESFGIGKKTTSQIEDFKNGKLKENEKIEEDGTISKRKDGDVTRSSNFAEMVAHQKWESITTWSNGVPVKFKALHTPVQDIDQPIKKGIDAIYENELFTGKIPPPKYIISEVKYNTAKLSTDVTKSGGSQMSELWVRYDLNFGAVSPEIRRDILKHGYTPILSHVSTTGEVTINTIEQTLTGAKKGVKWAGGIIK